MRGVAAGTKPQTEPTEHQVYLVATWTCGLEKGTVLKAAAQRALDHQDDDNGMGNCPCLLAAALPNTQQQATGPTPHRAAGRWRPGGSPSNAGESRILV